MTIKITHAAGYSRVDHVGPEIVRRAGEHHPSVAAARAAVRQAIAEMPDLVTREGAPRIVWERGSKHGVI